MKFTANRVSHLSRSVDLCDRVKSNVLSLCLTRSISVSLSPSYAAKPRRLSLSSSAAPFPSFPPLSFKKVSTTIAFTRYLLIVTALLRRHKSAVYDRLSGHDGVRGIPPAGLLPPMRLYDVVLHTYIYIYTRKKDLCWFEDGKNNIMIEEDVRITRGKNRWNTSFKTIEMSTMIFSMQYFYPYIKTSILSIEYIFTFPFYSSKAEFLG